jgi:hypothetical protein
VAMFRRLKEGFNVVVLVSTIPDTIVIQGNIYDILGVLDKMVR